MCAVCQTLSDDKISRKLLEYIYILLYKSLNCNQKLAARFIFVTVDRYIAKMI